jgi:hypothetical protein
VLLRVFAYRETSRLAVPLLDYPNIVPCLVLPFERTCLHENGRYPALVFARRGEVVLYADEKRREYGVARLAPDASLGTPRQFATLDHAAREFLACA